MRIAFLGLGAIGTPMAVHIAKAHELTVWNRTGATARRSPPRYPCTWRDPARSGRRRRGGDHLPPHIR